jgi:hypothetical protein
MVGFGATVGLLVGGGVGALVGCKETNDKRSMLDHYRLKQTRSKSK